MTLHPFDLIRLAGLDQRPPCFAPGGLLEGQGWRVQGVYGDRRGGAVQADSARRVVVAGLGGL